ncbi:Sec-independent protein translocase subunit TatA/TatB [Pectinatus sottacetonis]|uniref:Sec-independent protein translocase subunit TatA/TatB n=1 Tax=Pectinatus sottacetonis TaxID=1002795 RepID=UPI0018C6E6B4|nr:twin-arginine translocase TatA/TatE family subunit [Pectinatus sottacetonis]
MFGIGVPELIVILIIGLVLFGPGKLPEVGRAVGKSINELKKATAGITDAPQQSSQQPAQQPAATASVKTEEPAKTTAQSTNINTATQTNSTKTTNK